MDEAVGVFEDAAGFAREPELKQEVVVELLPTFNLVEATNSEGGLRKHRLIIRQSPLL